MGVYFGMAYEIVIWVALCAAPIAVLLGVAVFLLDRNLTALYGGMQSRIGPLQAGFLVFFAWLLGVVAAFFLLLVAPMSPVLAWFGAAESTPHYGRWAANLGIVVAIILWLRCAFRESFAALRSGYRRLC
jgi:hypothetical protein